MAIIMKAVILAGGLGTRIIEESHTKPKPMIEIGGKPIIWHILKIFSAYDVNEFIICCGYKGNLIKEFFANYSLYTSDITFHMDKNEMRVHHKKTEPWKVTLVDTGKDSMTGGRLKRVESHLDDEEFFFTYGDGVSDVNLKDLLNFHRSHNAEATITAVQPPGRFGSLELDNDEVIGFREKPQGDGGWINGGFFVLNPSIMSRINDDSTVWESDPMESLARDKQLKAYFHKGFWYAMDTLRDKQYLENLIKVNKAPWISW